MLLPVACDGNPDKPLPMSKDQPIALCSTLHRIYTCLHAPAMFLTFARGDSIHRILLPIVTRPRVLPLRRQAQQSDSANRMLWPQLIRPPLRVLLLRTAYLTLASSQPVHKPPLTSLRQGMNAKSPSPTNVLVHVSAASLITRSHSLRASSVVLSSWHKRLSNQSTAYGPQAFSSEGRSTLADP